MPTIEQLVVPICPDCDQPYREIDHYGLPTGYWACLEHDHWAWASNPSTIELLPDPGPWETGPYAGDDDG